MSRVAVFFLLAIATAVAAFPAALENDEGRLVRIVRAAAPGPDPTHYKKIQIGIEKYHGGHLGHLGHLGHHHGGHGLHGGYGGQGGYGQAYPSGGSFAQSSANAGAISGPFGGASFATANAGAQAYGR